MDDWCREISIHIEKYYYIGRIMQMRNFMMWHKRLLRSNLVKKVQKTIKM
jgi:hypothetical protein